MEGRTSRRFTVVIHVYDIVVKHLKLAWQRTKQLVINKLLVEIDPGPQDYNLNAVCSATLLLNSLGNLSFVNDIGKELSALPSVFENYCLAVYAATRLRAPGSLRIGDHIHLNLLKFLKR